MGEGGRDSERWTVVSRCLASGSPSAAQPLEELRDSIRSEITLRGGPLLELIPALFIIAGSVSGCTSCSAGSYASQPGKDISGNMRRELFAVMPLSWCSR
jgi:hypothetical protein